MGQQWVSIAEAAAAMRIHPRTVERRAAAGKLESRRNDDGQVQVYINLPEPEPTAPEPIPSEAFETVKEMADRQVDIAAGSASALVRAAQEQAMRAEHQMDLARQEAGRFRRETQMALTLVAIMLLFVIVAVGWCTHTITDARDRAANAERTAKAALADLEAAQSDLKKSLTSQAHAEGELSAYKTGVDTVIEQTKPRPATQPTTWFGRLTQVFAPG